MRQRSTLKTRMLALLIILLGFGMRLYTLASESLWYDELLQLDIAQGPLAELFPALSLHTAMPIDYLISFVWIGGGRHEFWVRFPAVIWGTLALAMAYQVGRRLLGRPAAGLVLMLLLNFSLFHVRYSQEVRPYSLVVFAVLLTVFGFWEFRRSLRRPFAWMLHIGILLFSLAHIFASLAILPLMFLAGVDWLIDGQQRRRARKVLGSILLASTTLLVILLALGWGDSLYYSARGYLYRYVIQPEIVPAAEAAAQPNVAPDTAIGLTITPRFIRTGILAPLASGNGLFALILFNGLVGFGLLTLAIQRQWRLASFLLVWALLPILIVTTFLVYRKAFYASRYIIATLPAYLLLATVAILKLVEWGRRVRGGDTVIFGAVFGLILLASWPALSRHYVTKDKEDWRLAGQIVAANAGPDDAVIAVNAEPTLNWYVGPVDVKPNTFARLAAIQETVARHERSWVAISIFTDYIEDSSKIKAWLGEQGAIRLDVDAEIGLYYLGPNASPETLLNEIRGFSLPVSHQLYASLARENRRNPAIARQYYKLAIAHAPDEETRAIYQSGLDALP